MILSSITKTHIEERLGKVIRYPSDYECLSSDIERVTRQRISVNTLKRLLGAIESVKEPRLFTLDVIAQYLGFQNWDFYVLSFNKEGNSEFENQVEQINDETCRQILTTELPKGVKVEFQYYPDRKIVVEHIEGKEFRVVSTSNSKLKLEDVVEIGNFYLNYPLIINSVTRNGLNVGRFTAGKISGLTFLKIIP